MADIDDRHYWYRVGGDSKIEPRWDRIGTWLGALLAFIGLVWMLVRK